MPMVRPKPRHGSHAPIGLLNENVPGVASLYETSQCGQCSAREKRNVRPSSAMTSARPLPRDIALSSASTRRARLLSRATERSATTSSGTVSGSAVTFAFPDFFAVFGLASFAALVRFASFFAASPSAASSSAPSTSLGRTSSRSRTTPPMRTRR